MTNRELASCARQAQRSAMHANGGKQKQESSAQHQLAEGLIIGANTVGGGAPTTTTVAAGAGAQAHPLDTGCATIVGEESFTVSNWILNDNIY